MKNVPSLRAPLAALRSGHTADATAGCCSHISELSLQAPFHSNLRRGVSKDSDERDASDGRGAAHSQSPRVAQPHEAQPAIAHTGDALCEAVWRCDVGESKYGVRMVVDEPATRPSTR